MEKIIKQKIDEVDNDLLLDTVKQASAELTMSKVTVFCFDMLWSWLNSHICLFRDMH